MQIEGKIEEFGILKENVGKNNSTLYRFVIGGKTLSGFKSLDIFNVKVNDYVIASYKEAPNKDPKKPPYKNLENLTPAVAPSEMKEEDAKVNIQPVGEQPCPQPEQPQATEEERWEKINAVKDKKILCGQVLNLTLAWIMNERRIEQTNKPDLDNNFNPIFDHIWKLAIEKRKEKLE